MRRATILVNFSTRLMPARHWKFDRRQHLQRARLSTQRSSAAKKEVGGRSALCRNGNFHHFLRPVGSAFMPRDYGVLPWWHALDRKAAISCAHREERMLQDTDISFHPRMLVAL